MQVKESKYGKYVEGKITLTIRAYLNKDQENISESLAQSLLETQLEHLAGSNDGCELLANASVNLI